MCENHEILQQQLLKAIDKCDVHKCHVILQTFNVNLPIDVQGRKPLTLAVLKNKPQIVATLLKYDIPYETRSSALAIALLDVDVNNINLEIIQQLVTSGAGLKPMQICKFYIRHHKKPQVWEKIVKTAFVNVNPKGRPDKNSPSLIDSLLMMFATVACMRQLHLPDTHSYMTNWRQYQSVHHLVMHGTNPQILWGAVWDTDTPEISTPRFIPDLGVLSLLMRTAVDCDESNNLRVVGVVESYLYDLLFTQIYTVSRLKRNPYSQLPVQLVQFPILENLDNLAQVMHWTGNVTLITSLKRMKQSLVHNVSITPETNEKLQQMCEACDRLQLILVPLNLQQLCRLCVQKNIREPNMLYSLNKMTNLPKSIKDMLLMENTTPVQELEEGAYLREDQKADVEPPSKKKSKCHIM